MKSRYKKFIIPILLILFATVIWARPLAVFAKNAWKWTNLTAKYKISASGLYYGLGYSQGSWYVADAREIGKGGALYQLTGNKKIDLTTNLTRLKVKKINDIIPAKSGILFITGITPRYVWKGSRGWSDLTALVDKAVPKNEGLSMVAVNGDQFAFVTASGTVSIVGWNAGYQRVLSARPIPPDSLLGGMGRGYYSPWRLPGLSGYGSLMTAVTKYADGFLVVWEEANNNLQAFVTNKSSKKMLPSQIELPLTELDSIASNGEQVLLIGQKAETYADGSVSLNREAAYLFDKDGVHDISTAIFSAAKGPVFANKLAARGATVTWTGKSWMIISGTHLFRYTAQGLVYMGDTTDYFTSTASDGNGTTYLTGARNVKGKAVPQLVMAKE